MKDYSRFVGIPFSEADNDRAGTNCWGNVRIFYRDEYGILLPQISEYPPVGIRARLAYDHYQAIGFLLIPNYPQAHIEGDVLMVKSMANPDNFVVVLNDGRWLTTSRRTGSCIVRPRRARVVFSFRHRELTRRG